MNKRKTDIRIRRVVLLTFLFGSISLAAVAQQPDPSFHIYLLMGQSNMAGRGVITEEYAKQRHSNVYMLTQDNQWIEASHPIHYDKPRIAGVGLGLSFGIEMADASPGVKIGLVPCAVGGTSIDVWTPGGFDQRTETHPYDDALVRIHAAMESGVIKGVLWHQGEADSSPAKAAMYLPKLKELIRRIREETGDPELPFVAGELGRYKDNDENINTELARLPQEVPHTAVVSSEVLFHKGDGTHFNSTSLSVFGKRYAEKMMELCPPANTNRLGTK